MILGPTGGISQGLGEGEALSSAPHSNITFQELFWKPPNGAPWFDKAWACWKTLPFSNYLLYQPTMDTYNPHCLPNTRVACVLLSRNLSYDVAEEAHHSLIRTFSLLKGLWWKSPREKEWNLGMKFRAVDPVRWCLKPYWVLFFKCAWRVSYMPVVVLRASPRLLHSIFTSLWR